MVYLPIDILYDILDLMSIKNVLLLSTTNKRLKNIIDTENFWKRRCKKDYKNIYIQNENNLYKEIYIKFYKKYCIVCNSHTRQKDIFYNQRVCKNCQRKTDKYICITKNQCKNVYNLTEKQISCINNKIYKNKYKMFLQQDILDYIKKYNLKDTLLKKKYKKSISEFNKTVLRLFKINILTCFLNYTLNINITDYIHYLNSYDPDNLLKKYINNLNVNKQNSCSELIYLFIQIDYLNNFNYDIFNLNKNNFEECILYLLINDIDGIGTTYNMYIENTKKDVYTKNIEKFKRKEKIKKYTGEIDNNIIRDYIYYGGNIFHTLDNYNEFIFLNKYFDLHNFYTYCLNTTSSLYLLLTINIQNYCDIFGYSDIPLCVIKKYNVSVK